MKKIKLNLDDLTVESFDTTPEAFAKEKGTVYGYIPPTFRDCTNEIDCGVDTCETCYVSCEDTCLGPECPP